MANLFFLEHLLDNPADSRIVVKEDWVLPKVNLSSCPCAQQDKAKEAAEGPQAAQKHHAENDTKGNIGIVAILEVA